MMNYDLVLGNTRGSGNEFGMHMIYIYMHIDRTPHENH